MSCVGCCVDGHTVSQPISVQSQNRHRGGYFTNNTAAVATADQHTGSILSPRSQNEGIRLVYDVLSSSPATAPKDVELRRRMQQMSLATASDQADIAQVEASGDRVVPKSGVTIENDANQSKDTQMLKPASKIDKTMVKGDQIVEEG
jgi:hypothetical protein